MKNTQQQNTPTTSNATNITFTLDRDMYSQSSDIYQWCTDNFKDGSWRIRNTFGYQVASFGNGADALAFALRWVPPKEQ